ncbi:hypothetical protein BDP27DRAFT_1315400 [Rhodocollybia butyracea]|uniref:MICOS complex subunit MIC12 n=1 Tax=Rhodocollybia butyracea TaxID=206335 RepID=A0A9P5Q6W6_9AGAR|nr:hypothetical protein BDP27DRAFT_1315400 [Rhodocollybia butyracea]
MSFLGSVFSGALVAGGIYYGFSNLIQTRTQQLSKDLHIQSTLLNRAPTPTWISTYPSPAASRIEHKPFLSLMQGSWNEHMEKAFVWAGEVDKHVVDAVGDVSEWAARKLAGKN